ncbi:MAG: hypothetical protein WCF25_04235 [Acidimicrobiales bacterium]
MNSSSNGGGVGSIAVLGLLIVIMVLVRRGRQNTSNETLAKGERIRPLLITLLDPVVSVIVIGPIFWHLTTTNVNHVIVAVIGGAVGVVIAWARAKVMYVRAVHAAKSVVLRRSPTEYALLALLIILRVIEDSVKHNRRGVESLVLTALISLAVVEPIGRTSFITMKYLKDEGAQPMPPPEPQPTDGPT